MTVTTHGTENLVPAHPPAAEESLGIKAAKSPNYFY